MKRSLAFGDTEVGEGGQRRRPDIELAWGSELELSGATVWEQREPQKREEGLFLDQRRAAEAGWEGIYRANLESRDASIPRTTFLGLEFLKIEQRGIWL